MSLTAQETDAENETRDRQQSIDLRDVENTNASPGLGSLLGLPSWLTQNWHPPKWLMSFLPPLSGVGGGSGGLSGLLTNSVADSVASPPLEVPDNGEFSNFWQRAQNFIDRMGNAKTTDDRLRHVLGWVLRVGS